MRAVCILPKKGWCCASYYMCPASRSIVIKSQGKLFSEISSSMWPALSSTKQSLSTLRQLSCLAELSYVAQQEGQKTQFSFSFWFILFFLNGHLWQKCSGCHKLSTTFWIVQYKTKFFTECCAISINSYNLFKRKELYITGSLQYVMIESRINSDSLVTMSSSETQYLVERLK